MYPLLDFLVQVLVFYNLDGLFFKMISQKPITIFVSL
jgi:hypothetical protein